MPYTEDEDVALGAVYDAVATGDDIARYSQDGGVVTALGDTMELRDTMTGIYLMLQDAEEGRFRSYSVLPAAFLEDNIEDEYALFVQDLGMDEVYDDPENLYFNALSELSIQNVQESGAEEIRLPADEAVVERYPELEELV